MTAELRRLAERSLADEPGTVDRLLSKENAQAILALLDERDNLAWNHEILHEANTAYERRVAALEKAYKRLASQRHSLSEQPVHMEHVFSECPHPDCLAARKVLAS